MTKTTRSIAAVAAIAAAALLSAGSVMAQEATPDTWLAQSQATKTRAEVAAELKTARANGTIRAWSAGYIEPNRSQEARATVKAETVRALRTGEVAAINAEAPALRAPKTRG